MTLPLYVINAKTGFSFTGMSDISGNCSTHNMYYKLFNTRQVYYRHTT